MQISFTLGSRRLSKVACSRCANYSDGRLMPRKSSRAERAGHRLLLKEITSVRLLGRAYCSKEFGWIGRNHSVGVAGICRHKRWAFNRVAEKLITEMAGLPF